MKALKSAILPTPKWAVVDFSDFNYTKLSDRGGDRSDRAGDRSDRSNRTGNRSDRSRDRSDRAREWSKN